LTYPKDTPATGNGEYTGNRDIGILGELSNFIPVDGEVQVGFPLDTASCIV
jgi:hypothetical protein